MHAPPCIMFNPTFSTCVSAESLTPWYLWFIQLHPRTHRCGVYEKIMNYFFVITRARKNKEGSCVMSRVAVLLRIHPWS